MSPRDTAPRSTPSLSSACTHRPPEYLMASAYFCSCASVAKTNVLPAKSVFLRGSTLHDTTPAFRVCSLRRGR